VSRALVRRRQRWRPPLRRRVELVGRPHGEPSPAVVYGRWHAFYFYVGGRQEPGHIYTHIPTYPHTRGARGDARRADAYIHRVGGRQPAWPIPTYPTRAGGGRRGRYPRTRHERRGSYHTQLKNATQELSHIVASTSKQSNIFGEAALPVVALRVRGSSPRNHDGVRHAADTLSPKPSHRERGLHAEAAAGRWFDELHSTRAAVTARCTLEKFAGWASSESSPSCIMIIVCGRVED